MDSQRILRDDLWTIIDLDILVILYEYSNA